MTRRRASAGWGAAGLLGLLLLCPAAAPSAAQQEAEARAEPERPEVRFRPRAGSREQRELARFLERGEYLLWVRDTVLSRTDTVPGPLLVLEGAARIAGTVRGSVYVVDGDLFLRPGARIAGDVVALGGGYYSSGLATVEGRVVYRPNEALRVVPERGGYRILPVGAAERALDLSGLYGFRFPTYQRVDGWTPSWEATLRAVGLTGRPEIRGRIGIRTEDGAVEGIGEGWWRPSARVRLGARGGRETRSNERWIRGDVANTFSFLLAGNDYRNYYRADHAALHVEVGGTTPWTGRGSIGWERASNLVASDRTILFASDSAQENPPVDPGEIISASGVLDYEFRSGPLRRALHLHLEGASREVAGDFSFLFAEGQFFVRQPAAAGHAVEAMGVARGDLAGSLPRQRWSALGGIGTLPTFELLALRGERMFLGELTYLIPIPALQVPAVGPTEALVRGTVGSAWGADAELDPEANLMAGIRFLFVEMAVAVDPAEDDLDPQFYVAGRWPRSLRGF